MLVRAAPSAEQDYNPLVFAFVLKRTMRRIPGKSGIGELKNVSLKSVGDVEWGLASNWWSQ
jgi:hypothetical protein